MIRRLAWLLVLSLSTSCVPAATMGTRTYLGFSIGIESAPPPPQVEFAGDPATEVVPGTDVYVVDNADYDMFQCEGVWYLSAGGYWYRAPRYAGPYVAVDVRRVPRSVLTLPHERWKHDPRGEHWDRNDRGRGHDDQGRDRGGNDDRGGR